MKLTIGIPTYNRGGKVLNLLTFLNEELLQIDERQQIEVIVSDNCSTDETPLLLQKLKDDNSLCYDLIVHRNSRNEGIIGNQVVLHNLAQGEYIWIMGDDDLYHNGIVKRVFCEVIKQRYSFIFVNYCRYKNHIGDELYVASVLDGIDTCRTDQDVLLDITRKMGGCLMYISASIHKTSNLKELQVAGYEINLAYPLLMSYYSASKGETKLIEDVYIDDVLGEISWSDKLSQVFYIDVPYCMRQTIKLNFNKEQAREMYISYIHKQGFPVSCYDFIKMIFVSPKQTIRKFVKHPRSLFKLLFTN